MRLTLVPLVLLAAVLAASGCESSQAKSARLAKHARGLANQKGLTVTRENPNVKVVGTAVLHDANGTAAVVRLRNTADAAQVQVPIAIDVTDAHGASIFKNDDAGLEASLAAAAVLPSKGKALWVNDQVTGAGKPEKVSAKVGPSRDALTGPLPKLVLSGAHLISDPQGVAAKGVIENRSKVEQRNLVIFGVVRAGGRIVAAGRGLVARLPPAPTKKPIRFTVFFIGDPRQGTLQLEAPPTVLR